MIRVDFDVPDRYLPLLRPGAPITARPDAYPDVVMTGRVAELDTRINTSTRAIRARAEFANGGRLIRPGACDLFCDALAFYCQDEEARRTAGLAGCEASKRYGWDEINHELVDAYIRIIRQHHGGGRQPRHSPVP